MTIAVCIKINDGIVLASDSATTILGQVTPGTPLVALNVYNNASKIFNLRKGFPVGAMTWGAGGIGTASVSTVIKDLRQRFCGSEPEHRDWVLDRGSYTVEAIATRVKNFIFDELYDQEYRNFPFEKPSIGFIVAGYSAGASMAEEFQIDIQNGICTGPRRLRDQKDVGLTWSGQPEALNRLILGYSTAFPGLLQAQLGINPAQMTQAMTNLSPQIQMPIVLPAMPLQDAIDLGKFLVDLTKKISRFGLGAPTVGGPIEIAAISKHEGFRWILRKHYFKRELNPEPGVDYKEEFENKRKEKNDDRS